jgi:hypothetical protein
MKLVLLLAIVLSIAAFAQTPQPTQPQTPPPAPKASAYQATPAEIEELDMLQLKAKRAVDAVNKSFADIAAHCKVIARAHKWPDNIECRISNPNDILSELVFEVPPKPEAKPAEPKK